MLICVSPGVWRPIVTNIRPGDCPSTERFDASPRAPKLLRPVTLVAAAQQCDEMAGYALWGVRVQLHTHRAMQLRALCRSNAAAGDQ